MKKFLMASAGILMLTGSVFAQSSALDVRTQFSEYMKDDVTLIDIFMDETGKDRDDADYDMRMSKVTPEQKVMMVKACTDAQTAKLGFSDMVSSRCKAITAPAQ